MDFSQAVEDLGIPHRARAALHTLMAAGPAATPTLRRGLRHPTPEVRIGCCNVLDHFLDDDAVPALIENLTHEHEDVRARAMHALACDKCKAGICRPGAAETIPIALRLLREDPSRRVRVEAVSLLFQAVHQNADVRNALERARDHDASPNVRKQAGLRAPGGSLFLRTSPDRPRLSKSGARAHLSAG
jgi:HEAT repeat protein